MKITKEEKNLLAKFFSGALDGKVGDSLETGGGSTVWISIKDGKISRYKKGPGGKVFNGKENERFEGVLHVLKEWITENEILEFFRDFGWLMDDSDAKAYSSKYKKK